MCNGIHISTCPCVSSKLTSSFVLPQNMTDSMKFGPEWLRNMSNDMGSSSAAGGGGGGGTMNNNNFTLSTSTGTNNIGTHTFSNSTTAQQTTINNNISSSSTGGGGSNGGTVGGNGGGGATIVGQQQTPRYQLAEFRYGREEMLSLFDKAIRLPEILPRFKKLFIDKIQNPLALSPNTEDDVTVSGVFLCILQYFFDYARFVWFSSWKRYFMSIPH